jgi:hypothetical protein
MITVHLEPEGRTVQVEKATTARRLLDKLGLRSTGALVLRHLDQPDHKGRRQALLTPDMQLRPGETVTVREVTSRG